MLLQRIPDLDNGDMRSAFTGCVCLLFCKVSETDLQLGLQRIPAYSRLCEREREREREEE